MQGSFDRSAIPSQYEEELNAVKSKLLVGKKYRYMMQEQIGRGAYGLLLQFLNAFIIRRSFYSIFHSS
jgi:hypothetical protein